MKFANQCYTRLEAAEGDNREQDRILGELDLSDGIGADGATYHYGDFEDQSCIIVRRCRPGVDVMDYQQGKYITYTAYDCSLGFLLNGE